MNIINSEFAATINRIIHHKEYIPSIHKKIELDPNDTGKDVIIHFLQVCHSFKVEDDMIYLIVDRSVDEINNDIYNSKQHVNSNINRLKNWINKSTDYKKQILDYLRFQKLDWIIDELK